MSVIKREDGIKFVIHTYRQVFLLKRISKVKDWIRRLSHDHGEYIRFFHRDENRIEAVFSKEPGFLLAESVWNYFHCPPDLIYCEILPDKVNALLVVIQKETVYLDAKLLLSDIPDELRSFMTGENQYHVYLYGNPPISDKFESGKFRIPTEDLGIFIILSESTFERLPVDENLQLQPLHLALRTQKIGKFPIKSWVIGISLFVTSVLLYWGWSLKPVSTAKAPVQKPIEKSYSTYEHAFLYAPNPTQLFEEFANLLVFSSSLPGWVINNIIYDSNTYTVNVKPQSQLSSLQLLEKWLKRFGLKFVLKREGIQFTVHSQALKRAKTPDMQELEKVSLVIIDKIKEIAPMGADLQVDNEYKKQGSAHSLGIKINFSSTSPDVLILLGRELLRFPVLIKEMNLSMDNNLLSGSLQLTVLGK